MKEQDHVAMYLKLDKWTNSDTETEKENEPTKMAEVKSQKI